MGMLTFVDALEKLTYVLRCCMFWLVPQLWRATYTPTKLSREKFAMMPNDWLYTGSASGVLLEDAHIGRIVFTRMCCLPCCLNVCSCPRITIFISPPSISWKMLAVSLSVSISNLFHGNFRMTTACNFCRKW
uniref:Uncharacterized protein n=1 Tax=Triticum urartu TaxID=4572 RepID=A0A8R7U503_TRIUA